MIDDRLSIKIDYQALTIKLARPPGARLSRDHSGSSADAVSDSMSNLRSFT